MLPSKAPHVLIVGSGITGLALAQSLKKIFESRSAESFHARSRDWGITLHWGSSLLHSCLPAEITGNLRSAQVNRRIEYTDNEAVTVVNTATGECLKSIPLGHAGRFSHRRLLSLLEGGVDVEYGKEVHEMTPSTTGPGVTIGFKDGSHAHGDLVVGADGRHSFVRGLLLGEEAATRQFEPLGLVMHNFVASYEEAQSRFILSRLHRFLDMGVNPDGTFFALVPLDIPDGAAAAAQFQIFISYARDPPKEEKQDTTNATILNTLKAKTKHFVEPFRSAIAWLTPDQVIHTGELFAMKVQPWENHGGRVTLAGDAAHPFPPHRGQALNHALQDVYNITQACVGASKTGTLPHTIAEYDAELVVRASAEMELSVRQSRMMHDWDALMQSPLMTIGARRVETGV